MVDILYIELLPSELKKLSGKITSCLGKTFLDEEDLIKGTIRSILKEVSTKALVFSYTTESGELEYVYVESFFNSRIIYLKELQEDKKVNNDSECKCATKKSHHTKPSYTIELTKPKSIFEGTIVPDGSKRNRLKVSSSKK